MSALFYAVLLKGKIGIPKEARILKGLYGALRGYKGLHGAIRLYKGLYKAPKAIQRLYSHTGP